MSARTALAAMALALTATALLSGCSGDAEADAKPKAESTGTGEFNLFEDVAEAVTETVEDIPVPEVFDPATATDAERWTEYQRRLTEQGVPPNIGTSQREIGGVSRNLCDNAPKDMAFYVDAMSYIYGPNKYDLAKSAALTLTEVYCPASTSRLQTAYDTYGM